MARNSALIFGLSETGVVTARALHTQGVDVLALDADPGALGLVSRRIKSRLVPDPEAESADLLREISAIARASPRPPVLFACSDRFASWLDSHRDELSRLCLFQPLSRERAETSWFEKDQQIALARACGVPHPSLLGKFGPRDSERAFAAAESWAYPVFLKPETSPGAGSDFLEKACLARSSLEARRFIERAHAARVPVVAQEAVPGDAHGNFEASVLVDRRGSVRAFFVMRKIRQQPSEIGVGTAGVAVLRNELLSLCRRMIDAAGFRGILNFEFKLDPRDGQYKFIEVNFRPWQQLDLAAECGINFPWLQYQDLVGDPIPELVELRAEGRIWIDALRDLESNLAAPKGLLSGFREWWALFRRASVVSLWDAKDLGPFIAKTAYGKKLLVLLRGMLKCLWEGRIR